MDEQLVYKELDQTWSDHTDSINIDLKSFRGIIFSDHHRGGGDAADDFTRCQRIYNSSLEYYNELDYNLLLLGDSEELWESRLSKVVRHHSDSLLREKKFLDDERYFRFYGNHDAVLKHPSKRKKLNPFLDDYTPLRALTINVKDGDELIGKLFLTHGDQGDHYGKVFRFILRHVWTRFQNLTRISVYLPSRDYELGRKLGSYHYRWSEELVKKEKEPVITICGHTHHAVFMSEHQQEYTQRLASKTPEHIDDGDDDEAMERAMEAWKNTPDTTVDKARGVVFPKNPIPSYFNSGCCAFMDGEITGLEIADGELKLVKWSGETGQPKREIMRCSPLKDIFKQLRLAKL